MDATPRRKFAEVKAGGGREPNFPQTATDFSQTATEPNSDATETTRQMMMMATDSTDATDSTEKRKFRGQ